jgi:hypothetical protein
MVQATEDRYCADVSGGHDRPTERCVFGEREVRARGIVVLGIVGHHAAQIRFAEHYQMVETLPPDGANQSFDMAILPGRAGRNRPMPTIYAIRT